MERLNGIATDTRGTYDRGISNKGIMKRFPHALYAILLFCLSGLTHAAEPIGKVILIQGQPIVERENKHLLITRNAPLFEGDTLITPIGSKLLLRLKDKTTVSLAENSLFILEKYSFTDSKSPAIARFKMIKGAFRTLTGLIGKQKDPKFTVHTPIATIGVRGTEFWGGMIFSDALDVLMLNGKGIYIENAKGLIEIKTDGLGTTVMSGNAPETAKTWATSKLNKAKEATSLKPSPTPSNPLGY